MVCLLGIRGRAPLALPVEHKNRAHTVARRRLNRVPLLRPRRRTIAATRTPASGSLIEASNLKQRDSSSPHSTSGVSPARVRRGGGSPESRRRDSPFQFTPLLIWIAITIYFHFTLVWIGIINCDTTFYTLPPYSNRYLMFFTLPPVTLHITPLVAGSFSSSFRRLSFAAGHRRASDAPRAAGRHRCRPAMKEGTASPPLDLRTA